MKEIRNGITIIVCSIRSELCDQLLQSINNTIGTDFEAIVFDNREKKLSISQVYNYCAKKANFTYLCFIHEDIIMPTPNWGATMIEFYEKTPNCGVIGFAGGVVANKNFLAWDYQRGRYRFYDAGQGCKTSNVADLNYMYNNPNNEDFAKVVTLDGLFLFVKKGIWEENHFDEEKIKGFHFYDADFSLGVAQKYQNYVCLTVDIYHFSGGEFDKTYYENAVVFQKKWKDKLPCMIDSQKNSIIDEINGAGYLFYKTYRYGIKNSIKHFIEINGLFYFLVFCILIPIKVTKKIVKRKR
jgi:hypothetical protein